MKNRFDRRNLRSITFIPVNLDGEEAIAVRDYRNDTREFNRNTIGEMNGMNHPTVHIPKGADVAWFRKWIC